MNTMRFDRWVIEKAIMTRSIWIGQRSKPVPKYKSYISLFGTIGIMFTMIPFQIVKKKIYILDRCSDNDLFEFS